MDRELTNRDWLLRKNEYDMLIEMNDKLTARSELTDIRTCVMCILPNVEEHRCYKFDVDCERCIQSWLNEKAVRL